MIRLILRALNDWRFRCAVADLDKLERQARAANDNRLIGRVRKERRERIHHALGWRGSAAR